MPRGHERLAVDVGRGPPSAFLPHGEGFLVLFHICFLEGRQRPCAEHPPAVSAAGRSSTREWCFHDLVILDF